MFAVKASKPIAVLSDAVVAVVKAPLPIAVFEAPVVIADKDK